MPSIFIGHGRSPQWRELQQFLSGELGLPCEDFEAVFVAGMAISERLDVMADEACFAFLVRTPGTNQGGQPGRSPREVQVNWPLRIR